MVKYFICGMVLLASCTQKPKQADASAVEFDTEALRLDNFTARVHRFLQTRDETKGADNYVAIFVNTEGCSACVKNGLDLISPYLEHTDRKTVIYLNDSSLLEAPLKNERLQYVWLPAETYKKQHIFHGDIYLYDVRNDRIRPIDLRPETTDSLDRL